MTAYVILFMAIYLAPFACQYNEEASIIKCQLFIFNYTNTFVIIARTHTKDLTLTA